MKRPISFTLNGKPVGTEVETWWTLSYLLREELGLTGTKEGCGMGECGACTVIVNGSAVASCIFPVMEADGAEVRTIEGLSDPFTGRIDDVQRAFVEEGAVQCGFCTPGMVMSARALLDENDDPSVEEIKTALEGNLCRCGGYPQVIRAVRSAAAGGRKGPKEV